MFGSFIGVSSGPSEQDDERTTAPVLSRGNAQPKRKQVSRACDWCRLHRIKCDAYSPCKNCQQRGGQCRKKNTAEIRSLPHALRLQIKDLETGAGHGRGPLTESNENISDATTCASSGPLSTTLDHNNVIKNATGVAAYHKRFEKRRWEGVYCRTARSQRSSYYGPSSSFYFLNRVNVCLVEELQQPYFDQQLQPHSASKSFSAPETPDVVVLGGGEDLPPRRYPASDQVFLSRTQEEYFLGLFWQFYYCTMPIVDERDLRAHYQSLWDDTEARIRKPSALVDIILALCMQYGCALLPSGSIPSGPEIDRNDSTIAGRWFYRRAQALLATDLESPSITALQCHIYTVVYLCCASFQNMAHSTLALAVRTAQILGLHLDPPLSLPPAERELRRRVWWVLSTVESKTCMKLGRSFSFQTIDVTCSLPSEDQEIAVSSGSILGNYGTDVTWLTYTVECQKLVSVARQIYEAVYDDYEEILRSRGLSRPYEDPNTLEDCAKALISYMGALQGWLNAVPEGIKTKRRDGGRPFSTDRSSLEIDQHAPIWLQRQRICLELVYHTLCMNFYRVFITFSSKYDVGIPMADAHASACINHAIAHTCMMHQVLSETDLLNGWHEAFQWQWNATVTMIGFLLAYPIGPSTPTARKAVDKAVAAFEIFGSNNVAVSRSAASVARDLVAKADVLINGLWSGLGVSSSMAQTPSAAANQPSTSQDGDQLRGQLNRWANSSSAIHERTDDFSDFMDLALTSSGGSIVGEE
ncbi:hypothetical protein N7495_009121 [Penicillium taxi]|uniref:uncharacterized protein n=1 Tax=Penicillium taxi TaxID=168475 RepID=UPI002544F5AD|nr:uncharacterized protein N7495_009121 [Penicillium taxi]KAJ5889080.1 hypothetical protein N7495_009121 [Penicillium taxi]